MKTTQLLLNTIVNKLGVEQAAEVVLEELMRKSFVAGLESANETVIVGSQTAHAASAYEKFQSWSYNDSLTCVPVEAVSE